MKNSLYLLSLFALMCSCSTKNTAEDPNGDKINYDLGLVCVKGEVQSVTYGDDVEQYKFVFNQNGKIIACYFISKSSEDAPNNTLPMIFKRDSLERICEVTKKYVGQTCSEAHIDEIVTKISYDSIGHLTQTSDENSVPRKYTDFDKSGSPTKIYTSDTTSISYSDIDYNDNWQKAVHEKNYSDFKSSVEYKREIVYFNTADFTNYNNFNEEDETNKYNEAIRTLNDTLAAQKERLQQELDKAGEPDYSLIPEWLYGTWELRNEYGTAKIVISEGHLEEYMDGEQTYSGDFYIDKSGLHYNSTIFPINYELEELYADNNGTLMDKVSSSSSSPSSSSYSQSSNSSSSRYNSSGKPNIYSSDSFLEAAIQAKIYNDEGGLLQIYRDGLWIGDRKISGAAPYIVSFNSAGGILKYQTVDGAHTITLMVDFDQSIVMGRVSGGTRNLWFRIR